MGAKKESHLLAQCKYVLRILSRQGQLAYRRIHVMPVIRKRLGAKILFSRNEDMAGMPDLMIFLPKGVTLHAELKAENGRPRQEQKAWQESLAQLGHDYRYVKSVDEFIEWLRSYGVFINWGWRGDGTKTTVSKKRETGQE